MIVGNGGIAMELIHEIKSCQVVWAIKDTHIGNAFFDQEPSSFLYNHYYKNGEDNNNNEDEDDKKIDNEIDNNLKIYDSNNLDIYDKSKVSRNSSIGPQWYNKYKFIGNVDASKINQKNENITIEYGTTIKSIDSDDGCEWNIMVELENGKSYGCDFVVSATGVLTNAMEIDFTPQMPDATIQNGYTVNGETMQTTIPNIFSAGDVCNIQWNHQTNNNNNNQYHQNWFQMKLWSQARIMGRYVAQCIAKKSVEKEIDDIDIISTSFEFEFRTDYSSSQYVRIYLYKGRLRGAILIGETDLEETFENLILNQIDLSRYGQELLNPNIDIEDYFD
ncbi:pyridine nucleotide-disulfide oxidoreductase domain-containing protein 1 [Cavenderia fasciculata]|uniref:Pyridine nucleotide-disulfide oxidoreductase domain-containing protein 1 n=1 Tax=Cavenderia fasciculata TaxID=261658 RepID=F4PVF9_CACFS|nr:pyridine nucleotide-disulfide oxidoreductase domain-containing protein 1 [Cavenderia fasciculata]EGG19973.1 pyridine nucleotide-disulfide oxidoreductase domain-containing protein 1 [Cavenderia fasciculata]|eukprot:XP_004366956.1 pyridine nucleotide-disulfide oxidoreductase domain-containing protein 1 [Cavenderia fasciculata]